MTGPSRGVLCTATLTASLLGCVTIYQPMAGLHTPIAVNVDAANLEGINLHLRCVPAPPLGEDDARMLCRKVARLFENQGATVDTNATLARSVEPVEGQAETPAAPPEPSKPALHVELSSRLIHHDKRTFLWWSRTNDYTFAQDVVVRDARGFLLSRAHLTGRFVTRLGFFTDTEEAFSRDFYGQLSQIALNAKMRQRVLAEGAK